MLTDDGYRQLMKHAKRLAQEGHGELAQHLRDAIDLRAEVEALRADVALKRDLLLWTLYHHQGGSSAVSQTIRKALGIGQFDHLTPEQIADAARAAQGGRG